MSESVKKLVMPVVVLTVICLVVTGALAAAFQVTDPIVQAAAAKAAEEARTAVLPEGSGFTDVTARYEDRLPSRVKEVYAAENGAGYVFSLTTKGYNGDMKLMVGITSGGTIAGVKALDISNEDPGMGSRVGDEPFTSQFPGKDAALEGVDTISGSTVSSSSYIAAVKDAFTAFELIAGKEGA